MATNERQKRQSDANFYRGLTYWDGFWKIREGLQRPEYDKSIRYFKAAAKQGHADAQYYLGIAYMHALGVPRDDQKAVRCWFRKSADQGHADAQYYLGIAYMHALGVPRDDQKAVQWFRKSADQGHAGAQNNLGIMYSEGWGIEQKNEKEAVELFLQAENNGDENAAVNRGVMYLQKPEMKDNAREEAQRLLCPYKESNARACYYYWHTLQEESEGSEWWKWSDKAEKLGSSRAKVNREYYFYGEDSGSHVFDEDISFNTRNADYYVQVHDRERERDEACTE